MALFAPEVGGPGRNELAHPGRVGSPRRRVLAVTFKDGDGYSAFAANLPGVFGAGDTFDGALASLREGLLAAFEEYASEPDATIPWRDESAADLPADAQRLWILV